MIDLNQLEKRDVSELVTGQTPDDLRRLVHDMVEAQLAMIEGTVDADVTFTPVDEAAHDAAAATEGEVGMAWTLGHVIVHNCASAEESAFLAAELARGVPNHGRSRHERHWTTMHTLQDCREVLEESRRMRLATLEVWPQRPNLELQHEVWTGGPIVNAMGRFVVGHVHERSHFDQIREIVRQAAAARI